MLYLSFISWLICLSWAIAEPSLVSREAVLLQVAEARVRACASFKRSIFSQLYALHLNFDTMVHIAGELFRGALKTIRHKLVCAILCPFTLPEMRCDTSWLLHSIQVSLCSSIRHWRLLSAGQRSTGRATSTTRLRSVTDSPYGKITWT